MQLSLIQSKIYKIRGQKVMPDRELASLYEVETRVLHQSVQRNLARFPTDFMIQLAKAEQNFKKIHHALNLLLEHKLAQEEQKNREPSVLKQTHHETI